MMRWSGLISVLAIACGGGGGSGDTGGTSPGTTAIETGDGGAGPTTATVGDSSGDGSTGDTTGEPADPHELAQLCPGGLPVAYERDPEGADVSPKEIGDATAQYLDLLTSLRYFDFIAERTHGWPQSDPMGRYWFGTWWSGVGVIKDQGSVTYEHGPSGGDNNGLRTGPVLEGACYAYALWGRPEDELLVREMVRGLIAWMIAMEREPDDPDAPLLTRAFYPMSIDADEGTHAYFIDYSQNHPGIDASPSEYVRIENNPHWGDIWIKNKRSKDDIGHMLRAIAQLGACEPMFVDPAARDEFEQVRTLYAQWSRKVQEDGWKIATLDKSGEVWFPPDTLANFIEGVECASVLSMRLLGHGDPGTLDCGNGIGPIDDAIIATTDHNGNILRSFHEAAANNALLTGNDDLAMALLGGIAERVAEGLDGLEGVGEPVPWLTDNDQADMMLHGLAAGVPLTAREVRWLHGQMATAASTFTNPTNDPILNTFDAATPDGAYSYNPFGQGIDFKSLGGVLAACASPCVNETTQPLVDCDMVRAWSP